MTTFSKGDKVSVLDDNFNGVVSDVKGDEITVETDDGFLIKFKSSELIKVHETCLLNSKTVSFNLAEIKKIKETPKPRPSVTEKVKGELPPPEFDLHIEKLAKNHRSMSNYEILTLQSETAKRHIEFALRNRIPKIVFIHGVGEGVLKAELDFLLGRYDNIIFRDADYRKYGGGATEVVFKQNPK
ncbi:MAG: DNA mismatch repair protein MutS [Flavobacterium sp.]|nr:MAG: DNA mismatch repair protein MutS [Flavobacterium sp.]